MSERRGLGPSTYVPLALAVVTVLVSVWSVQALSDASFGARASLDAASHFAAGQGVLLGFGLVGLGSAGSAIFFALRDSRSAPAAILVVVAAFPALLLSIGYVYAVAIFAGRI